MSHDAVRILTVNGGSTSLKLERYDLDGIPHAIADPPVPTYTAQPATDESDDGIAAAMREPVDVVAHRFVRLPDNVPAVIRLDAEAIAKIKGVEADAPLHDASALHVVDGIRRRWPDVPQFAVSDSAFHRTMTAAATTYAIPRALTATGIRRIGFHGLSHEYAAHRGCAIAGLDVLHARVVTAHLGGGSSLCAIRDGASVDTTMGYTPLEGIPMATRSGSVDPGLLVHLLRTGMSVDELEKMLEKESGLLGISGVSEDVRTLQSAAAHADAGARLALDVLAWRVRAALGASIATLGGVDLIVFTGGIGEHAADVRIAALEGGLGVGAVIRAGDNAAGEGRISADNSTVAVAVVPAREGWQLARPFGSPGRKRYRIYG